MAITTYSELKTAIENWLAQTNLSGQYDEFIALCEDRVHNGGEEPYFSQPLRVQAMVQANETFTIDAQTEAHPTSFLEAISFYLNTDPRAVLTYIPPIRFWQTNEASSTSTGQPTIYTIVGTNFVFASPPDSTYTGKLSYFKKLTGLSGSNADNWLLLNSPGTYLYGCLLEAYLYDKNYEEADKMFAQFTSRINALIRRDKEMRYSGSILVARPDKVR